MFKNILIAALLITAVACGGGGGGGTATTNIQGNISSQRVRGDFEGIRVEIEGSSSFSDVTDSSGSFEILGIPSGQLVTLVFSDDGKSARVQVDTPANTTVILQNISLNASTGVASPEQTVVSSASSSASSVSSSEDDSSDDDSSMSSDDDSSDDNSSDDNSSDDNSSDDDNGDDNGDDEDDNGDDNGGGNSGGGNSGGN